MLYLKFEMIILLGNMLKSFSLISTNFLRVKSKTMFLNDKLHRWKFSITSGAAIDILAEKRIKLNQEALQSIYWNLVTRLRAGWLKNRGLIPRGIWAPKYVRICVLCILYHKVRLLGKKH